MFVSELWSAHYESTTRRLQPRQRSLSVGVWWWPSQQSTVNSQHSTRLTLATVNCLLVMTWFTEAGPTNLLQWPHNSSSGQFCVIINCLLSWDQSDISNWHYCFLSSVQLLRRLPPILSWWLIFDLFSFISDLSKYIKLLWSILC